eukprot:UN29391
MWLLPASKPSTGGNPAWYKYMLGTNRHLSKCKFDYEPKGEIYYKSTRTRKFNKEFCARGRYYADRALWMPTTPMGGITEIEDINGKVFKKNTTLNCVVISIQQYLHHTYKEFQRFTSKPRNNRSRYLVTLPLLSTAGAGNSERRGELLNMLFPLLNKACEVYEYDIGLICWDTPTYSAAIKMRADFFPNLFADRLSQQARDSAKKLSALFK